MDLERILQGTPGTLSQQWYEDGVAVDPGTVTIAITRRDGTVLVAAGTGTTGAGTNPRTYSLTTTHTALLDKFTVTWTSTGKGTLTSRLEVVGGYLFDLAELIAVRPTNQTWTTADMLDTRTEVEQALEEACGVAFVPRYALETFSASGTSILQTRWPKIRAVRSALISGDTVGTLTDVVGLADGLLYYASTWTTGFGNVTVGYEHGYDEAPGEIKRAALKLARTWLIGRRSPIDDRAITFATTDGGTYSLAVPGRNGSYFGDPDVDAAIDRYSLRAGVA